MSKVYIHSRKYGKRGKYFKSLIAAGCLLIIALGASKIYFHHGGLDHSSQTTISNQSTTVNGYINAYFFFKDSAKWVQDKADSTANVVIYNQYISGQPLRQLIVYMNKVPNNGLLASSRVLSVNIVGRDSLSAGGVSEPCANQLPAGQLTVQEVTINKVTMICNPSAKDYSVVLGIPGGNYQLKLSTTRTATDFIILYKDTSGHNDPDQIINIANSFKAI